MRILFCLSILFFAGFLAAQTMLPAAEWCAAGKKFAAMAPPPGGTDLRSDSVDILKTTIELDLSDFAGKKLGGKATLDFQSKVSGLSKLRFDLLGLIVDSVTGGSAANWAYDGQQILVKLAPALTLGQQGSISIYYHGQPVQDASGWGGFYWQGQYGYNLGVGFAADPHSFGRAWHPCFDNFVERCTYQFLITSKADQPSFCNGHLVEELLLPGGKIQRNWVLDESIPSYLACVAIGPYTAFKREYSGEQGAIPVTIAVSPADTNKLKTSFVHLPDALAAFEHWFGPYRWDKIGYSIVPFTGGAMEHATNIAYMQQAVDGGTGSETVMAHEFSHHWWGDLATCSTAEDMWLNEGWAVFSEHLFEEWVYGRARYDEVVRSNFLTVLEKVHANEGGYRAVSGVPHDLTYGQHVYNKGAVVAHNLRGYLGDSLFRTGLRSVLDDNKFKDWSSAVFRDKLSAATGKNLSDFFNDWVFSPGFPHFSVDSVTMIFSPIDAPTQVIVYVKQKLRGAPHFYQNVPLEFTFVNAQGQRSYRTATVSGEISVLQFEFPAFQPPPVRVWLNTRQLITIARADKELVAHTKENLNFAQAKMNLLINSLNVDSVLFRVEHHYAMPDTAGTANPEGFRLTNRYWSVDALPDTGFDGDATVFYDGKGKLDQLDTELFDQTGPSEDSIIAVYRPGPGKPWQLWPDFTKNTLGSSQDRGGFLRIAHIKPGQYTIAKGSATVATKEPKLKALNASISPNPGRNMVRIKADEAFDRIQIFNAAGELMRDQAVPGVHETNLSIENLPAGNYQIILTGKNRKGTLAFQKGF